MPGVYLWVIQVAVCSEPRHLPSLDSGFFICKLKDLHQIAREFLFKPTTFKSNHRTYEVGLQKTVMTNSSAASPRLWSGLHLPAFLDENQTMVNCPDVPNVQMFGMETQLVND